MLNILTIDLEDYFMVSAFEDVVKREDWNNYESRIERNTYRLLGILNRPSCNPIRATFFCLGWVAERYPQLIREIHHQGHEIACHGYDHRLIYNMIPGKFREDVRKARKILEDIIGEEVVGYRAPSYSITNKSQWAFEVLVEEGFKYDSSVFPIRHDFYGMPEAPRFPFIVSLNGNNNFEFSVLNFEVGTAGLQHGSIGVLNNSILKPQSSVLEVNSSSDVSAPHRSDTAAHYTIIEFPISTVKIFCQNFPISGGGYFRLFPYPFIKMGLKRINNVEKKPFIFYVHPWELDFEQPRIKEVRLRSRFRHYVNLDKTEFKFKKLLSDFQFSSIKQLLRDNGSTS